MRLPRTTTPRTRRSARTSARTALVAIAALLVLPVPVAAQDPPADLGDVEAAAASWLVEEYDAGAVTTGGALVDLILGLAGAGAAPATVAAATADLKAVASEYVGADADPGRLAKVLLGVLAGGGDGNDVAGQDVEARLRATVQAQGEDAGRFGDANLFTHSLALLALASTDGGAPAEAAAWLADQRCPDGGFEFAPFDSTGDGTGERVPCSEAGGGHVDTTTLAVQALRDADEAADDRDGAIAWLLAQQHADGSFDGNANSSGLAAQALRAAGHQEAADAAAGFVATLQHGSDTPDAGAIRHRPDGDGSLLLATAQGILAFGAPAMQDLRSAGAAAEPQVVGEACDDDAGVTVVVDLTAFDGTVHLGCAPGDPGSGLDALRGAGLEVVTQSSEFGEYVCAIEGHPELACEQPFEGSYWAYFAGEGDGSWSAYEIGADTSDPAPGGVEGWAYSDGSPPSVPAPGAVVERLAAVDRVATAVAISQDAFAEDGAAAAVLARADDFADALAGTPLAVAVDGPLLITPPTDLPDVVADELRRALPEGATVHVLGGGAAIAGAVVDEVRAAGFSVERVAGEDRIATAVAVADALGDVAQVLLTTGYDFADALAAGAAAAAGGDAAVLLTGHGTAHPAVDAYLREHDVPAFAIGGPAAAAYADATPVVGATREATAVEVAEAFFDAPTTVGIARRDAFADALAGGADAARRGGPLLLTPTAELSPDAAAYLCATDAVTAGVVYGGTAAVATSVSVAVADAVRGAGCP